MLNMILITLRILWLVAGLIEMLTESFIGLIPCEQRFKKLIRKENAYFLFQMFKRKIMRSVLKKSHNCKYCTVIGMIERFCLHTVYY